MRLPMNDPDLENLTWGAVLAEKETPVKKKRLLSAFWCSLSGFLVKQFAEQATPDAHSGDTRPGRSTST